MDGTTQASTAMLPQSGPPGTAKVGARNYPLREKAMPPAPERSIKKKAEIIDRFKPDYLGVKPPEYTTSSYVDQSKFTLKHQEQKLCNTVHSVTFKPRTEALDYKLFAQSTIRHPPAQLGGPAVQSITFTKNEFAGPWNASTIQSYEDFAAAQEKFDTKAQAATKHATSKIISQYSSPQDREKMRMETMRQQKRQEREYRAALLETYGADGAEAILKAQSVVKDTRPRGKVSKEDLHAIKELDVFDPTLPLETKSQLSRQEGANDKGL